jgi:hypothetical protein
VLEVHDFTIPESSFEDGSPRGSNSSEDGDDGYPGYDARRGGFALGLKIFGWS